MGLHRSLFAPLMCALLASSSKAASPPNLLFIMSDDHAVNAVGSYGGRHSALDPTPALDRLAERGVRFTNCFCSNSICVPSRATLLTGLYAHHHGIRTLDGALKANRQTLAHRMRNAGYQTAIIGKWHLGAEPAAFDYYCVLKSQGKYFNPAFRVRGPEPWPLNTWRPSDHSYDSVHSSDAITDASICWLRQRDRGRPFFLMHHFKAPHDNFENAERFDWLYADDKLPEPENLFGDIDHGPRESARYGTSVSKRNTRRNMGQQMATPADMPAREYTRESYQRYLKKYLRCVRGVDDNIARLLSFLEESGDLANTIVVYTSDQGFMLGEHDYIDKRWGYEESMRMPLIVAGPGVPQRSEPIDAMVTNVDFLPTLLVLAGVESPHEGVDGRSFASLLRGKPGLHESRDAVYYRYWMHMTHHDVPAHCAVRTRRYKLLYFYGRALGAAGALDQPTPPHWELYNLASDPEENRNLAGSVAHRGVVRRLARRLLELKHSVGDYDEIDCEIALVAGL